MPTIANVYGVIEPGTPLVPVAIERRDVGPHDVSIDIAFCGICHSDIHFATGELGPLPTGPLVPGHEIVGVVTEVGAEVNKHRVGDRVGIGCMVDSCRQFGSPDRDGTITQGGYSQAVVANEDFVVPSSPTPSTSC